jgi:RNA polymerase subunit RPABC4/transcription elongation factor Spt4
MMEEYVCKHCKGITSIKIVKESEKATEPEVEFCPLCGMSNEYGKEAEND